MAIINYTSDNLSIFYGTTTKDPRGCIRFGSITPFQIIGLVPCEIIDPNLCPPKPCITVPAFNTDVKGNTFLFDFPDNTLPADFRLETLDNNGAWQFANTTLGSGQLGIDEGEKFDIGTITGYPSYGGYKIDWSKVYNELGTGIYRFVVYNSTEPTQSLYSYSFNLMVYSCNAANNTVKIELDQKGFFSNWNYTRKNGLSRVFDVESLRWTDNSRYYGKLIPESPTQIEENVRFANNSNQVYYTDEEPNYNLQLFTQTWDTYKRLTNYGLKGENIVITDNNQDSVHSFDNLDIIGKSESSFESFRQYRKLENVSIKLRGRYNQDFQKCY